MREEIRWDKCFECLGYRTEINTEISGTSSIDYNIHWIGIIIDWFMFNDFDIYTFQVNRNSY